MPHVIGNLCTGVDALHQLGQDATGEFRSPDSDRLPLTTQGLYMLVKCSGCGKEISDNARICPHCKCDTVASRKAETRACRVCKTPLIVKNHLSTEYKSTPWIIDRSSVTAWLKYTPCPNCGEPRPILPDSEVPLMRRWAKKFAIPILLLAVAGIAWAAYLNYAGG
ncbi:MAG: zinc ribbon domain-containing protein [Gallionella sp.]|nr:zinc ribbon domain-containing protein [Gallionella sp.]